MTEKSPVSDRMAVVEKRYGKTTKGTAEAPKRRSAEAPKPGKWKINKINKISVSDNGKSVEIEAKKKF